MGYDEPTGRGPAEDAHRLLAEGRVRDALSAYERAVGRRPDFLPARVGRLRALVLLGDFAGAVAEARTLCRILDQRGDIERIPDVVQIVLDVFPAAAPMLGGPLREALATAH